MNVLGFLTGKKKKEETNQKNDLQSPNTSPLIGGGGGLGNSTNSFLTTSGGNSNTNTNNTNVNPLFDNIPPLNEIQILSHHEGPIKNLLKIDSERLASAGDDNVILIWSISTGRLLMRLQEHDDNVTCLLSFGNILVSGSRDKTIKIWNLSRSTTYNEITKSHHLDSSKTLSKYHQRGLKFLEKIPGGFCSASNDEDLVIWNEDGEYIRNIVRIHKEYIHGILCVNNYIITSSSNPYLVAYRYDGQMEAPKQLADHKDCVNCLMNISDRHFVTGSQDRSIILWDSLTLVPVYQQQCHASINYLFPIKNYILATINKGFSIFDMKGKTLLEYKPQDEHSCTEMMGAITLYDNTRILTWADTRVTFWSWNINDFNPKRNKILKPQWIGEMKGHTSYINCLTVLEDNSIATGSSDCNIILWKDGKYQSAIRNMIVSASLFEWDLFNNSERDEDFDKVESADEIVLNSE
ncbi:hypothetical protein DLAC_06720 [Tieghemostelium lacteum]|uniref:WD40 repeat-containing protein n=1 Tax=Tieghemostelium lacteum TaxID=361077 RepID=A0A151ZFG9_TIELA|nr:hypothetical protein DLAC_06720 [Tieghemostelium lacteum]|eukprot:KYQ92716.1 hypothetical protein DLAC_06720 [Tieghemostelium lacteum]